MKAEAFVEEVIWPIGDDYFKNGVGQMNFVFGGRLVFNAFIFK